MKDTHPATALVSIIIVTYNSEEYVLETLESSLAQTYQNLELILSDDGSSDGTIAIFQNWIAINKERFAKSQILTVKENTGIPANCNRGIAAASGKWIKIIAGDDILLPDCISDLLDFAEKYGYKHVLSDMKCLKEGKISDYFDYKREMEPFFKLNVKAKYDYYLTYPFFINVPSGFFEKAMVERLQLFDEQFRILEDQPYFYTLLRNGIDLGYLKKPTVIYRIHSGSLMGKVNTDLYKALYKCYLQYRKPYIPDNFKGKLLKLLIEKHFKRQIYYNGNTFLKKGMITFYNSLIRRISSIAFNTKNYLREK